MPVVISPNWPAPGSVGAASTLRAGGSSTGPYASLNLGAHVGDDAETVASNRRAVAAMLDLPAEPSWLEQVHGTRIAELDAPSGGPADGAVTSRPDRVCVVLTADCLPVLLATAGGERVGVAHAGWRGTLNNIAGETIAAMQESYGAEPAKIRAAIGPAIGPCCYEVSEELIGRFHDRLKCDIKDIAEPAHKPSETGRSGRRLDLPKINRIQLEEAGLIRANIDPTNICTACRSDIFFSHRYEADEEKGAGTGRQLSLIMNH